MPHRNPIGPEADTPFGSALRIDRTAGHPRWPGHLWAQSLKLVRGSIDREPASSTCHPGAAQSRNPAGMTVRCAHSTTQMGIPAGLSPRRVGAGAMQMAQLSGLRNAPDPNDGRQIPRNAAHGGPPGNRLAMIARHRPGARCDGPDGYRIRHQAPDCRRDP